MAFTLKSRPQAPASFWPDLLLSATANGQTDVAAACSSYVTGQALAVNGGMYM